MNTNPGYIITSAVPPSSAASPQPLLYLPSGLLAGLLAGLVAAFAADRRDDRVHTVREAERLGGLPVLYSVDARRLSPPGAVAPARSAAGRGYAELAHAVAAGLGEKDRVLLVAAGSPGPAAGVVAANLAAALARVRADVILVCADPRDTMTPALLGVGAARGLAEVLGGTATVAEVTRQAADVSRLEVITPGRDPAAAPGQVRHDVTERLVDGLRRDARYVIICGLASGDGADTFGLAGFADAALVVLELDRTRRPELAACLRRLDRVQTPVLGAALLPEITADRGPRRGGAAGQRGRGRGRGGAAVSASGSAAPGSIAVTGPRRAPGPARQDQRVSPGPSGSGRGSLARSFPARSAAAGQASAMGRRVRAAPRARPGRRAAAGRRARARVRAGLPPRWPTPAVSRRACGRSRRPAPAGSPAGSPPSLRQPSRPGTRTTRPGTRTRRTTRSRPGMPAARSARTCPGARTIPRAGNRRTDRPDGPAPSRPGTPRPRPARARPARPRLVPARPPARGLANRRGRQVSQAARSQPGDRDPRSHPALSLHGDRPGRLAPNRPAAPPAPPVPAPPAREPAAPSPPGAAQRRPGPSPPGPSASQPGPSRCGAASARPAPSRPAAPPTRPSPRPPGRPISSPGPVRLPGAPPRPGPCRRPRVTLVRPGPVHQTPRTAPPGPADHDPGRAGAQPGRRGAATPAPQTARGRWLAGHPAWPVVALLAGYPLWWALGVADFAWIGFAVPIGRLLAWRLHRSRPVRLPRGWVCGWCSCCSRWPGS